jgi:serine/threonine protein kinase
MLSISAILAIAAAAAISAGVVVILLLNSYYTTTSARSRGRDAAALSDGAKSMMRRQQLMSSSARSLRGGAGKLVMFSRRAKTSTDGDSVDSGGGDDHDDDDLGSSSEEEWVSSAHALLSKDSELAAAGGGSGSIYKAVLGDGRTVVIKKLAISKPQREFEREVEPLGRIKHRNVVALRGYYWTPEMQLLIYDFVPNGSLYKRLHEAGANEDCDEAALPWRAQFEIAAGVAKGLAHLHHRCDPIVVHANVKSANVLLDERCDPKLADTGLLFARLLDQHRRHKNNNNNNNQNKQLHREHCIAPELFASDNSFGKPCPSIDVYGFGIIVLELVTGRRPVEYARGDPVPLRDFVRSSLDASMAMLCVDPKLPPDQYSEAEILPMIKLGLVCCSRDPRSRPTMAEVLQILDLIRA